MPSFSDCQLASSVFSSEQLKDNSLAFWRLGDLTDSSVNGNTLTNTNSVQFVAGKIGNCAEFNGTSNFLSLVSFSSAFNSSSPYTISIWHNITTLKSLFTLVGCSSSQSLHIHGSSSGALSVNNSSTGDVSIASFFVTNEWHHLVITRNSSSFIKVYKDALLVYNAVAGVTYGSVPNLQLGSLQGSGLFFMSGKLDAVGLWDQELNQQDVNILYNGGRGYEP